ncbi:MAG TPA: hypothetical protein VFG74_01865 [Miltoncostaeaceae bacterium]|jgi:hypothetical protein|nr:hypothetical protein [Miltoncostaeaceae bacterium]
MDVGDWLPVAWFAAAEIGAWLVIAWLAVLAFRGRGGRGSTR